MYFSSENLGNIVFSAEPRRLFDAPEMPNMDNIPDLQILELPKTSEQIAGNTKKEEELKEKQKEAQQAAQQEQGESLQAFAAANAGYDLGIDVEDLNISNVSQSSVQDSDSARMEADVEEKNDLFSEGEKTR